MAVHQLSSHFDRFFNRLNPGASFEATASSQYNTIKGLIENLSGPAAALSPTCFLQGSYRQQTAIYTINDVDIVVLCSLWQPGEPGGGPGWDRNRIFDTIAAPLYGDGRYASKIRFGPSSMCIKVDLGIKVEILPVVYAKDNYDSQKEPFRLWRPENASWEDGYARRHQVLLTGKNQACGGNFIPMIKVLKHLRSEFDKEVVSFHLECLLYAVPNWIFFGAPADYIADVLAYLANTSASTWYAQRIMTPCGERDIFTGKEWTAEKWTIFHQAMALWSRSATFAKNTQDRPSAIQIWQAVLGDGFFPATVS